MVRRSRMSCSIGCFAGPRRTSRKRVLVHVSDVVFAQTTGTSWVVPCAFLGAAAADLVAVAFPTAGAFAGAGRADLAAVGFGFAATVFLAAGVGKAAVTKTSFASVPGAISTGFTASVTTNVSSEVVAFAPTCRFVDLEEVRRVRVVAFDAPAFGDRVTLI